MAAAPGTVTMHKGVTWKTILIIILLIASLSLLAALPLSFFMSGNMGDWFGNIPLELLPPPDQPPDLPEGEWEIPEGWEIPDWWVNWTIPPGTTLPSDFNGTLPPGDIPWWLGNGSMSYTLPNGSLPGGGGVGNGTGIDGGDGDGGGSGSGGVGGLPGMGGSMGNGLGPFGSGFTTVYVNYSQPWRYWRIRVYDYFEGTTWILENTTTTLYSTDNTPGTDYLVMIRVQFTQAGYGTLPLPHLWNRPMIRSSLQFLDGGTMLPATNVTWDLLEDQCGVVHWNATVGIPGIYYIVYFVTYNNSINLSSIESNVYFDSPLNFIADPPGSQDYLQMPDLSAYPEVVADMQALASNPAITSNNTYETAQAVMEYFKTRWYWTPFRVQIPGQDFDPGYLINNGYGMSADFASNYVIYLRNLNISSRLVWGGVGYQPDPLLPGMMRLSHSHFWAEVWIPYSTTPGDGEWVQFDPNPIPPVMWMPNQSAPQQLIRIDARRNDTRVETSHYTMLFNASVPYDTPQNPGDLFDLTGTLLRDGTVLTTTWLNESVFYTYADVTENSLVGISPGAYNNHNFTANSRAGPHRFNASFYAVQNETIVTCNGTTEVNIISLNPHSIVRGTGDAFLVDANITDASNGQPISDVELLGYVIEIDRDLSDNLGRQLTDSNGEVNSSYSFPSNESEGVYNFTMRFNGTFVVDYPNPYPDYFVTVPGSAAQSQNETITVTATLYINITSPSNPILPRGHTIAFNGYLTYDNLTGINGGLVTVWWANSTGTYAICADNTAANGFYQGFYYIPEDYDDSAGNNDVRVWANFSVVWGNATTDPSTTYQIRCTNQTNIILNTDSASIPSPFAVRGETSIHVWGSLSDSLGIASTAGQYIEIKVNETDTTLGFLIALDANGNFDTYVQIPDTHPIGDYNLSAVFSGVWIFGSNFTFVPSSASWSAINNTHRVRIVATTVLSKTTFTSTVGRIVTPTPIIAGDPVYVGGYLLFENGTGFGSQLVEAWWIAENGTESFMNSAITQASTGFYNITYNVGYQEPTNVDIKVNYSAGSLVNSFILNASTKADPPVVWAVNVSIDTVTPSETTRGQTTLQVTGRLREKHNNPVPNELIILTFNGSNALDQNRDPVTVVTDSQGNFSTSFIVYESFTIGDYDISATLTNSSFILNQEQTANVEVNCTTQIINMAIDRTGMRGENITISGSLVDNANQAFAGDISVYFDGDLETSKSVNGAFSLDLEIPDDSASVGMKTITLNYSGTSNTYPSSTEQLWNVPKGADIAITNIAGYSSFVDLTLNAGSQITISGSVNDNESTETIQNRVVEIYYNNSLLGSGNTNSQGEFSIEVTLPSIAGNATIYANFTAYGEYTSQIITAEIIIPESIGDIILQYLPWIIGIVVGIIAVYVAHSLYSRRSKKQKMGKMSEFAGIDIEFIKTKLKALLQGKRYREGIIYSYYIFLKIMQNYFDSPKRPSQTARDYAMEIAVKRTKLPPTMIYPFTTLFEDARYGNKPIDENHYSKAFRLFMNLCVRIMERPRELGKEPSDNANED
ncbi:MAG: DUF4129 domain-containing protein [Candidatus Helarchaeota archaeon]|nr:DUF4129 domain-containing protein [Candidatus Helarchaeota archaeon]